MSSMTRAAFILPILLATTATSSAALAQQPRAAAPAVSVGQVNNAVALWRQLRQGGNYRFTDYARLIVYNPDFPGESALRQRAERAMQAGENPALVIAFFRDEKPSTGNGYARLADSLAASGRAAEALAAARQAWASPDLGASDEPSLYARWGSAFTTQDHDRRADALLFDKKAADAQRFLGMVSPARRGAFTARVGMQLRWADAESRYQSVIGQVTSDAGLMMDRARYLRDGNNDSYARQLFARPHNFTARPADPDRFLEMALALANGANQDRQYQLAYNIGRQVDDLLPSGADLADQSYGVRDKYTSLTWLAGSIAFGSLRSHANAVAMFDRYARGGKSAQVSTKGLYWAGRAAAASGNLAGSGDYFRRASAFPELFYGQLALERLGQRVPMPNPLPTFAVGPAQRAEFNNRPIVIATRLLGQQGRPDEQALFIRSLAESLTNDAERTVAIELGRQIGRQDMGVWVARSARNKGQAFYVQDAFPRHASGVPNSVWSLAHAITRQESSFDRRAVSHAGARGLMQLMPGTAREQAGKMGLGYDYARLTSDPNYNVMLGSAYFQRLLNSWNGSVPLAVASYNAGAGNVRKWVRNYGDPRQPNADVLGWIERIPFSETKGYVQRVIENSVVYDSMNPSRTPQSSLHVSRYLGKSRPL
ncbi:MAG: lytic transglycosylase domain-containing protein [Pseudomonadota bacterium]|nr:lytic transglycosylase domain-containing protein [Pseudomonadota bacterium]